MRTLPWSWYSDPGILRREQQAIFRSAWHYLGHTGSLGQAGDRIVGDAGGVPVLVVRDREGGLRGFVNVCRHRGSVLVSEPGRAETIQCPYHAWTYDLDGSLRKAPRAEEGFETEGLSLVPVRVETWGPLVFANASAEAPPLAEALDGLPELMGVDLDALVFERREEYALAANWKIACENYLECYHCPTAHRGFSEVFDVRPGSYLLEERDGFLSQYTDARDGGGRAQFHLVWPSLKVYSMQGAPNFAIGPVIPDGPSASKGFLDYFFAPDANPEWKRELLELDDQVGAEDRVLVEAVQRGVSSGAIAEGRLLPESERLVAAFQRYVAERLGSYRTDAI